ncbi:PIN domain-containing protein [Candidatus Bathyarchaeota archaeon]|nr:PIN domain-containing protein [Candidatus Bathyarchaeota archaeon]
MIYVDTGLIISYVDLKDPNHVKAERIVSSINSERKVVSMLVLVELASVYSRAGLEKPLELALYSLELIGAEILEIDHNEVLRKAFRMTSTLKMRTLDLLHLTACSLIKANRFATLDQEIVSKANIILEALEIEIVA